MVFSASGLPWQAGDSNSSYFSTNNSQVAAMLTLTTNASGITPPGLGPIWDFSQLQQSNETLVRADMVAPAEGMDGGCFPDATYAEQDTAISPTATNQTGWCYYSLTSTGRVDYGLYVPDTGADGLAVFAPAMVDVPATVTNGQTWTYSTAWNSTIYGIYPVTYLFSDTSQADALGTMVLPNLGIFSALRVHEVHVYTGLLYGAYTVEIVTNQCYYWLVQNLGVVAQITMYGNNMVGGETPAFTNSVQRMYYASYYTNAPSPTEYAITGNLHIQMQSGSVFLTWNITNSTSYQVQANGSLNSANWQVLGLTSNTNWTDSLSTTQRFYRVVGLP